MVVSWIPDTTETSHTICLQEIQIVRREFVANQHIFIRMFLIESTPFDLLFLELSIQTFFFQNEGDLKHKWLFGPPKLDPNLLRSFPSVSLRQENVAFNLHSV